MQIDICCQESELKMEKVLSPYSSGGVEPRAALNVSQRTDQQRQVLRSICPLLYTENHLSPASYC